jgi:hypothetical protein
VISRDKSGVTKPQAPWTSIDVAELRRLAPLGVREVALILARSEGSVRQQAARLRISLRRQGERRGLVLGQPRGVAFDDPAMKALREQVLAGQADVERIVRRALAWARGADLCPSCAINPIEVESTGFCTACHKRELARAHAREDDELQAQRELDRERQRKHRRKAKAS